MVQCTECKYVLFVPDNNDWELNIYRTGKHICSLYDKEVKKGNCCYSFCRRKGGKK